MRGFRPSYFAEDDEVEAEDAEQFLKAIEVARRARIPLYARRAQAGLSVFDRAPSQRAQRPGAEALRADA